MVSLPHRLRPSPWWAGVLVLALAAAIRSAWLALGSVPIVEGTDAAWYAILGENLLSGHGLSLDRGARYDPTMYREPGYALFVGAVYAVAGQQPMAVGMFQSALLAPIVALVALVGRRAFGPAAGLVGAALVVVSPDQADLARQVLSETVFTLLLCATVLLVLHSRPHGRLSAAIAVGLLFGVTALTRVQGQLLLGLLLPMWLLLDRWHFGRWRLAQLGLVAAIAALVLLPWTLRNLHLFDRAALTQRYSALLPRAARATYGLDQNAQWLGQAAWIATNPLSAAIYPLERFQYGPRYFENDIWDFHITLSTKLVGWGARACEAAETDGPIAVERALRELPLNARSYVDYTNWQAKFEDCALGMGMRLVREHPLAYAIQTPFEWVRLTFYPLPSRLAAYRNTLIWVAYAGVAWLLWRRRLGPDAQWVAAVVVAYTLQGVVGDAHERYGVPVLPLYYAFAAAALVAAGRWLLDRWPTTLAPAWLRSRATLPRPTAARPHPGSK